MNYDYSKLNGRIVEKCRTRYIFASRMGLSEHTLSMKLTGKVPFKQTEIQKAMDILELNENDIGEYFFTKKVQ